jgi:ketosteroid isomerase-like protein
MQRREYLAGVVAASSIAIAGCGGGSGSSGPTGVIEDFVSAINDGDGEAARDLYHEDSPGQPPQNIEQSEQLDFTLDSAETVDEDPGYSADEYDNVDEFQVVEATISISGEMMGEEVDESETSNIVVAKNSDGEWKIWEGQ